MMRKESTIVYNYAEVGATATMDIRDQVRWFLAQFPTPSTPEFQAPLHPNRTLYIIFIGANDIGSNDEPDVTKIVEKIMDAAHHLYMDAKASQILFINMLPIECSPGRTTNKAFYKFQVEEFNENLLNRVIELKENAFIFNPTYYSIHSLLNNIFKYPRLMGFKRKDVRNAGSIWKDDIHLTSTIHKMIAEDIFKTIIEAQYPHMLMHDSNDKK